MGINSLTAIIFVQPISPWNSLEKPFLNFQAYRKSWDLATIMAKFWPGKCIEKRLEA